MHSVLLRRWLGHLGDGKDIRRVISVTAVTKGFSLGDVATPGT